MLDRQLSLDAPGSLGRRHHSGLHAVKAHLLVDLAIARPAFSILKSSITSRATRRDVLDFRERRRQAQYDAIAATSFDVDHEAELDDIFAEARAARAAVAARRRTEG